MKLSIAARNARLNAIAALVDAGSGSGLIDIYDGTQPANVDTAVSGQTKLSQLTMSATAFLAAAAGVMSADAITADADADADGQGTWFRITDSDGNAVIDGTVGATGSGADLELNTTTFSIGVEVQVSSLVITDGNA